MVFDVKKTSCRKQISRVRCVSTCFVAISHVQTAEMLRNTWLSLWKERGIPLETDTSPVYSKPFFELQLIFAQKMADLSQQPFEQAVLESTAFYPDPA